MGLVFPPGGAGAGTGEEAPPVGGMSVPGVIPGILTFRENMEWLTRCGHLTGKHLSQAAQQAPGGGQNEVLFVFTAQLGLRSPRDTRSTRRMSPHISMCKGKEEQAQGTPVKAE